LVDELLQETLPTFEKDLRERQKQTLSAQIPQASAPTDADRASYLKTPRVH
jgi:hypothetical protein